MAQNIFFIFVFFYDFSWFKNKVKILKWLKLTKLIENTYFLDFFSNFWNVYKNEGKELGYNRPHI
jgi:hypothetical protein